MKLIYCYEQIKDYYYLVIISVNAARFNYFLEKYIFYLFCVPKAFLSK